MKTPSHLPAHIIVKTTKIPRRSFYNRVASLGVRYIEPFRGDRLYDVKHWTKLNPDYPMPDQIGV